MKIYKQLLRQPVKTAFGILLITLAVAILCVCVGQALAVQTTAESLNHQFSTVALPLGTELNTSSDPRIGEELLAWLDETAQAHPDIVKEIARHGILSAYIPELTPLNATTEQYMPETVTHENMVYYYYQSTPRLMPYTCAMLVITLEEIGEPVEQTYSTTVEDPSDSNFLTTASYLEWYKSAEKETVTTGYSVKLTGTVTEVISLQEGYRDPVGRVARLTVTAPTLEEIEAMDLVPGEQYIVYGMDYSDEFWKLIGEMRQLGVTRALEPFDPSKVEVLSEEEKERRHSYEGKYLVTDRFVNAYAMYYKTMLFQSEYEMLNASSMTLGLPVPLTEYEAIREESDGTLLELRPKTNVTYTDGNGEDVTLSFEEYNAHYQIPTIARLDSSVEDFLKSEEGELWQAALSRDAINNQAFAVIGVDKLGYLADFAREKVKIVAGRDFTPEELENGDRVCIIHEALAEANGLQVGDTVTANFYATDFGLPYQDLRSEGRGILNPSASFYFDTTPFTETAAYTIVGICRGESEFPDVAQGGEYSFSANTVFVPKASVQTQMETCDSISLVTPVLQNGKIEEFHTLAARSGHAGRFKYYDQNYSVIADNFHNYETLAQQILMIGIVVYAVLLLLFLLLYPGALKKSVRTMETVGAASGKRVGYVLASSMAILVPASVLGCALGTLLWDRVLNALQTSAEAALELQLEPGALAAVAGAQLILALILDLCVALFMAAPRGLSGRR